MNDGMLYALFLCIIFGIFLAIAFGFVGSRQQLGAWKKDE